MPTIEAKITIEKDNIRIQLDVMAFQAEVITENIKLEIAVISEKKLTESIAILLYFFPRILIIN